MTPPPHLMMLLPRRSRFRRTECLDCTSGPPAGCRLPLLRNWRCPLWTERRSGTGFSRAFANFGCGPVPSRSSRMAVHPKPTASWRSGASRRRAPRREQAALPSFFHEHRPPKGGGCGLFLNTRSKRRPSREARAFGVRGQVRAFERDDRSSRWLRTGAGFPRIPQTFLSAVSRAFQPARRRDGSGNHFVCGAWPTGKSAVRVWNRAPPAVWSTADFPVCRIAGFPTRQPSAHRARPTSARPADWEIGDTAGWETCGTFSSNARKAPHVPTLLHHRH
jgi:hypothetical protein